MEPEFVEQVKELDGVEKVLPVHVFDNQIQAGGTTFSRLEATDNLDRYNSMFALHYTDTEERSQALSSFRNEEHVILLSENYMEENGFPGRYTYSVKRYRPVPIRVAGSFKSRATDNQAVIPPPARSLIRCPGI
ncbi:MAG: hypothetical protein ACLRMZ_14295 [Blautia marasmi]